MENVAFKMPAGRCCTGGALNESDDRMNRAPSPLIPIAEPGQAAAPEPRAGLRGWPVLRLGFRPFYLGTALLACLSVPLWVGLFLGHMRLDLPLPPLWWHAHEMLFGFAAGVIAGFLLTAVRAWTGLRTPQGPLLGALVVLWLVARVLAVTGPAVWFVVLDLALLPLVGVLLLRVLYQAGNDRNIPLIGILLLMTLANAVFHAAAQGWLPLDWAMRALYAQLGLILMVISVVTGRVVPLFTRNVTPGLKNAVPRKFELTLLAVTAVTLAAWVLQLSAVLTAALAGVSALLHARRLWLWRPLVTLRRPILWILHFSYAWMPVGFAMLALAQFGWVAETLAVHAFAVGVTGGLIIGMVTRTARGHTGRPLQTSRLEVTAYVLVLLAAVSRVLLPALWPAAYVRGVELSSVLWSLGFLLYLVQYTPWLLRARADGKDG